MKNRILKTVLIAGIIITLTIADFVLVGTKLVTYALENGNVKFTAYFRTEEGEETSKINYETTNNQMKLYLEVSVEGGVAFNGVVTLEDSNFKLKNKLSEGISKIEGNTITLNSVRAGNTSNIELEIEPITEESYVEDNLLNKESVLKLTGNYDDGTEETKSIEEERRVTLNLIAPENIDTDLEGKVITNRIYKIGENNKRILQIEVNSRVVDNVYPINNTEFNLQLPNGVEELEVITKGTYATDGKDDRKLQENNDYIWNRTSNLLQVKLENVSKDGKISWKQDAVDNIIVTLILPEDIEIATEEYNVKSIIQIYGQEKTLEKELKYNLSQAADGIIRASIDNKETIYKGKLYSREEREYKSITNIEVNYANLIENASVKESVAYRIEENSENKAANIIYKSTTISKSEFEKILGAEGSLIIKDQNENTVKEVKSTDFDENGNLTINYAEGVQSLTIEVTKPIETGVIRLNHTKAIKEEGQYSETEIDAIKYFVEQVEVSYSTAKYTFERKKTLRETTSEVGITVTAQSISSERKNEVPIAITLKTDNEKYKLFENPTFTLTMPEGVTINSVSDGTESQLFGGLSISKLEAISSRKIRIELSGVQTEYIESNINSQINFTANLSVEKLMPNKVDTIKMQYENKGNKYNMESEPINVIASNSKVVTHLKLENYNGTGATIEKYSYNTQDVSGELPLEKTEEIEAKLTYTIINNYTSAINATLVAIDSNYIDNEKNTTDLIAFTEQNLEVKAGEMKQFTQILKIPARLYYGEKIDIKTLLEYSYSGTLYQLRNDLNFATEGKDGLRDTTTIDNKIQIETFAQLGDGSAVSKNDEVYNEQIIKYIIEVTNVSNETISNLTVTNKQTNGNIYDIEEIWVNNWVISLEPIKEHRYGELETNTKTFEVGTLNPGEHRELVCRVVVKKVEPDNTTTANISVSADGIEERQVQTLSNMVKDSDIKIYSRKYSNEEVDLGGDSTLKILSFVKNLTGLEINNMKARLYLSDGLTWNEDYAVEAVDSEEAEYDIIKNIQYNEEKNYLEFYITKLEVDQEITIISNFYMKPIPLDKNSADEKVHIEINDIIANDVDIHIIQTETTLSITQNVNINENQKVKNGEKVIITGELTNTGNLNTRATIEDYLPSGLEVSKVEIIKKGESNDKTAECLDGIINISTEIEKNEKIVVNIETTVNTSRITTNEVKNKIIAIPLAGEIVASEEVIIQIESDVDTNIGIQEPDIDNPDEEDSENKAPEIPDDQTPEEPTPEEPIPEEPTPDDPNPDDPNPDNPKPDNPNPDNGKKEKYTISGNVWIDKNKNEIKDDDEAIKDVIVKIIDLNNKNTFLKDKNGNEIEEKTDKNGAYEIKEVPKGKYNVIFKYNTEIYELKQNAEVKDYIIESTKEKVAITNNINLENNKTIDLELIELTEFNLKMDKYISKVIVQTANGTKTTEYINKQLVREEIQKKYLPGATVLVEYTIEVSNVGKLTGYATQIIDYIPKDMKFYSELNTQWYIGEDGNLYNTTLASSAINPGETKKVKLILSKTITKENTGTTSNIAEISETMNIKGYTDIDLNNNKSKAEIIVNPATGTIIAYALAILISIAIVALGMYIIKKKVLGKE